MENNHYIEKLLEDILFQLRKSDKKFLVIIRKLETSVQDDDYEDKKILRSEVAKVLQTAEQIEA